MPKSNVKFWMDKWAKNVKRDIRNEEAWREAGWNVVIVWGRALAGEKRKTLERICEKIESWAAELADGRVRLVLHRLELPHKRKRG